MAWLHAVVDVPADRHAATAEFWGRVTGWQAGAPWQDHPELRSFEPPSGSPYLHLQQIDGPARVHLDLETDDPGATAGRAVDLGAELVPGHEGWQTLRSPGGLPFCVLHAREHEPPEPVTWPDGHRSRMVQVCVDSPSGVHDQEVAFWRRLLGDRWASSRAREFAGKWHDDAGSPLQLLFQRLDEAGGRVRAHLDHGTDDQAAEVRRLLHLGAADLGAGRGWHVLRDPAGLPFCVTPNSPETARVREIG
jgi:hypothetical protein